MIKVLRLSDAPRDGRDGRHRPRLRRPGPGRAAWASPPPPTGVDGLIALPDFDEIDDRLRRHLGQGPRAQRRRARSRTARRLIDLTPAAIGPYVVPAVNLDEHLDAPQRQHGHLRRPGDHPDRRRDLRASTPVPYAEIVASIASKSAGPGTRANIDEFTETTSRAIEAVGGAARGKAIIVLNPAEPPLIMRDTVLCLVGRRGRPRRPIRDSRRGDGRPTSRPTCPATGSSRRCSSPPIAADAAASRTLLAGRLPAGRPTRCRSSSRSRAPPTTCRPTPATSTS